jgi:hypothetical protein
MLAHSPWYPSFQVPSLSRQEFLDILQQKLGYAILDDDAIQRTPKPGTGRLPLVTSIIIYGLDDQPGCSAQFECAFGR